MPVTDKTVARFWDFFAANAAALRALPPEAFGTSRLYGQLTDQLAKCHKRLKPEVEMTDGDWTFVVTADGDASLFKFVEQVVAAAPPVPGWKTVGFRQRSRMEGIRLQFGPHALSPDDVSGTVVAAAGGQVGVTLFVRGYDPDHDTGVGRGAEILLDHAIREYDAAKSVARVQLEPFPDVVPADAVPLALLPAALDRTLGCG